MRNRQGCRQVARTFFLSLKNQKPSSSGGRGAARNANAHETSIVDRSLLTILRHPECVKGGGRPSFCALTCPQVDQKRFSPKKEDKSAEKRRRTGNEINREIYGPPILPTPKNKNDGKKKQNNEK